MTYFYVNIIYSYFCYLKQIYEFIILVYSKQFSFCFWDPLGFISVIDLNALLKHGITVRLLWLLLPVHSGSLR